MLSRKTLFTILAALCISAVAMTPVLADGSPPGGSSGDNSIHPWDINDGTATPGNGVDDAQAPTLSIVVFYSGWYSGFLGSPFIVTEVVRTGDNTDRINASTSQPRLDSKSTRIRNLRR